MDTETIKPTLIEWFENECGLSCVKSEDLLFSSRTVDSIHIIELLTYCEKKFGVSISPLDVGFENFDSIDRMASFISSLKQ